MIHLYFEDLPYHALLKKLQQLVREEKGDRKLQLENQRKEKLTSAEPSIVGSRNPS